MSEHSQTQRLAVLTILADADEMPTRKRLAELIGCKHPQHGSYYLDVLVGGGMLTISDYETEGGVVVREVAMTAAAWAAIGRTPPAEPKSFTRRRSRTGGGLRKSGERPRATDEPQKEPQPCGILASIGRYDHDWDGDNFRRVSLEDMRRRCSPRP